MDSILRGAFVYLFLLLLVRVSGKRTLHQVTPFDAVLLLIISESIQQAMIGSDNSATNAVLLVLTLVAIDIGLSLLKQRSTRLSRVIDSVPVILMEPGRVHRVRMNKERIDENDVLQSARVIHGIARMEEIGYAVLEQSGEISIVRATRDKS